MTGARLGDLDAFVPMAGRRGGGHFDTNRPGVDEGPVPRSSTARAAKASWSSWDFTGYACTNCRWMRANMLSKPEIAAVLKDFVSVALYTDGGDAASEANQKLQLEKFGTIAEPFYVILDPDGKLIGKFEGQTKDVPEYLAFLNEGIAAGQPAGAGAQGQGREGAGQTAGSGLPHVHQALRSTCRDRGPSGKSGGREFLGHLVRALYSGDSQLQQTT